MGIFFGQEKRQFAQEPPIPAFYGAPVSGGGRGLTQSQIQTGTALTVPTVWACVGLLANTVSMLPMETFRRTDGIPVRISDPLIVTSPASGMTQSEWLHMLMCSLLLRGNAYGRIAARDSQQRPTQIELLNPDHVRVEVDEDTGAVRYRVGTSQALFPAAQMWHVRGMTLPGTKVGLSPISYAAATLGIDLSSREFANDFFNGGGIPKAVLTSDQRIEQDAASRIKERLLAATRRREPLILGAGLSYNMVQVSPGESQFLETQQANVAQIARYFWIPPEMVGGAGGGSLTYANVEQRSLDFLTYAVSFWLKRIEDSFFDLLPQPEYVRFNAATLLRTDAETEARVSVQLVAGKIKVPSEIRATYNLAPMTPAQLDEAGMVPLSVSALGAPHAKPVAPPALEPVQVNSAPNITINNQQPQPAEVRLTQPITVQPSVAPEVHLNIEPAQVRLEQPITVSPAEVRQDIHVQPAAPAEIRLEQPITVQPSAPAEVRLVNVGGDKRTVRTVERNNDGDIVRIVEE